MHLTPFFYICSNQIVDYADISAIVKSVLFNQSMYLGDEKSNRSSGDWLQYALTVGQANRTQ